MVSVSEENVSGIDTHFRKYRIGGINTFGIVSPITTLGKGNKPGIHGLCIPVDSFDLRCESVTYQLYQGR